LARELGDPTNTTPAAASAAAAAAARDITDVGLAGTRESAVPAMSGRENGTGGNASEEVRRAWVMCVDVVYVCVCECVCVCLQCL